jgi:broad specificity phosphatase PhoE
MTDAQIWPDLLYVVRHGESSGNVARDAAVRAGPAI